jgi:hypothetical protein
VAAEWGAELSRRFTGKQLDHIIEFLVSTNEITRRHIARISD